MNMLKIKYVLEKQLNEQGIFLFCEYYDDILSKIHRYTFKLDLKFLETLIKKSNSSLLKGFDEN